MAAVSGQVRGTVTLACTFNTGTLDLAEMLERVRDRHPGVIVKLRQSSSGSAGNLRSVRDGSVDIALCASGGNGHVSDLSRGVVLYDLWSEPMVFVCRPDHALAGRDRVAAADLREEMILRFPPGWGVRAIVDSALGDTQSAFEIIDYTLMMRLARAGFGTTLVPASAVAGRARARACARSRSTTPRMRWNLSAAVSADRQLTAATKTLLAALIQGSR